MAPRRFCQDSWDESNAQGERKLWQTIMMDEARRVKEAIHFTDSATFSVAPPPTLGK